MLRFSLKTKVTLFFPLAITIALAGILLLMHALLGDYTKKLISNQQFQIVSILSDEIDRENPIHSYITACPFPQAHS